MRLGQDDGGEAFRDAGLYPVGELLVGLGAIGAVRGGARSVRSTNWLCAGRGHDAALRFDAPRVPDTVSIGVSCRVLVEPPWREDQEGDKWWTAVFP